MGAKIVFVGSHGVGKTSIITRYQDRLFNDNVKATVGVGWTRVSVDYEGQDVSLDCWDTAGQEQYNSLMPMYFRDADAVVIVADLSLYDSLSHIDDYYLMARGVVPDDCYYIVVGNKTDAPRDERIDERTIPAYGDKIDALFSIETSAVEGNGIDELFYNIARAISGKQMREKPVLDVLRSNNKGCC